jgi:hypothetical protein
MTPRDKRGQEIVPGDYIVYGHALGRCAGLRFGKVLKISEVEPTWRGQSPWRIKVQGVDDDWAGSPPFLCKPGTLQFPNRIVVLAASQLPFEIFQMLCDVQVSK